MLQEWVATWSVARRGNSWTMPQHLPPVTFRSMQQITELADRHVFAALETARSNVLLASPYLGARIAFRLSDMAAHSHASWQLLTALDPWAAAGGYLAQPGLRALLDAGVEVRDLRRLHAKTYLVDEEFGLIGSANLTDTGLGGGARPNAELSAHLDKQGVAKARAVVEAWWQEAEPIDTERLDAFAAEVDALPRMPRTRPTPTAPANLEDGAIEQLLSDTRDPGRKLWVKAQTLHDELAPWRAPHWFSNHGGRGRPRIETGDLVAIYSTPHHGIIAIVEVTSDSREDPSFVRRQRGWASDEPVKHPWVNNTPPRLVPTDLTVVDPVAVGMSAGQVSSLQGGWIGLPPEVFTSVVRALADGGA